MTNFNRIILYVTACLVIVISAWIVRSEYRSRSIAYIDIGRLVDNYKFKKDLEGAASVNLYRIKGTIDSLQMIRKSINGYAPTLDSQLITAQRVFNEYYTATNQQITEKVWDRLNPVIQDYGNEKAIHLLVGANGAGTVLYGSKSTDLTDDLIAYVNTKYEKGN